jgi:hypothetical protein
MTSAELSYARGEDPQLWHRARTPGRRRELERLAWEQNMAAFVRRFRALGTELARFGARAPDHST